MTPQQIIDNYKELTGNATFSRRDILAQLLILNGFYANESEGVIKLLTDLNERTNISYQKLIDIYSSLNSANETSTANLLQSVDDSLKNSVGSVKLADLLTDFEGNSIAQLIKELAFNLPRNKYNEFINTQNQVGNVPFSVDFQDFRSFSVQITGMSGTDAIIFEGSNNGAVWTPVPLTNTNTLGATNNVNSSNGNATFRAVDQGLKFLRGRITAGSGLGYVNCWTVMKR